MKINACSFLIFLFAAVNGTAQGNTTQLNLEHGIALQGYDPVSYFTSDKAIKGSKAYSQMYDGATYYFSSSSNRETFLLNPSQYTPQYGGWCAYAMGASGEKVEIDPESYIITDGKLYVFYYSLFNDTRSKWNNNEASLKASADKNWKKIIK